MPKLSIVIPTYNREVYLKETLDCIVKQINSSIEIVVSDNCSSDNTEEMISVFKKSNSCITYTRLPENMGFDKNLLNGLKHASGDYCWIFSSDDLIEDGALNIVLQKIKDFDGVTGISLNGSGYTKCMSKKIINSTVMNYKNLRSDCFYSDAEAAYCELGDYFGFISGQVLRRDVLLQVMTDKSINNYLNGYIHVYLIGKMLQVKPAWLYVHEPLIKWRSGNDSISGLGRVKRLAVDVKGYSEITKAVFGVRSNAYKSIQSRVCNIIVCASIIDAKRSGYSSLDYLVSIFKLCFPYYWNCKPFWLRVVPIIMMPSYVINSIIKFKAFVKMNGATKLNF